MKVFLHKLLLLSGDLLIFYGALALALFVRRPEFFFQDYFILHAFAFSFIFPVWLLTYLVLDLYEFRQIQELPTLIGDTLLAFVVIMTLSTGMLYLFPKDFMTPKTHLLLAAMFSCAAGFGWRRLWLGMVSSNMLMQKIAFLGDNPVINEILHDLQTKRFSSYKVIPSDIVTARLRINGQEPADGPQAVGLKSLVDLIVVDGEQVEMDPDFEKTMISLAMTEDVPIRTHLDFYEELYGKIPPEKAAKASWLLDHVFSREREVYLWFKRAGCSVVAAVGLVAALPLFATVMLVNKVFGGGDVFYSQRRIGYMGKEFTFWKLRTMVPDADKKGYLWNVGKNDSRVTRLGRFLRRWRLDELPQLWNVLKRDMSIIGPRPTWVGEKQALALPHYHLRHLVKPGITGWAQIRSRSTNSFEDTVEKLHYDLYYVKHISLSLDIAILLKTLRRVFQREEYFSKRRKTAGIDAVKYTPQTAVPESNPQEPAVSPAAEPVTEPRIASQEAQ